MKPKRKEANYALPLDGIAARRKQLYFSLIDGASPLMLLYYTFVRNATSMLAAAAGSVALLINRNQEEEKYRHKILLLGAFWTAFANIKGLKSWPGGLIYGMFFQKGIYDNSPINNFLESWFGGRHTVRHFSIGVTDVLTGKIKFSK